MDALAARRACSSSSAWSNAPVCAPARTDDHHRACIRRHWAAEHMRSDGADAGRARRCFRSSCARPATTARTTARRTTTSRKPGQVWDESSGKAHWRNRAAGQPFFAIFNSTAEPRKPDPQAPAPAVHDPAKVRVPGLSSRHARGARRTGRSITTRSARPTPTAGEQLKELEDAGLADDTIVFYYADHGSGMPRSKRWPCNSGLQVPLVVYFPQKWRHLAPKEYAAGRQVGPPGQLRRSCARPC